LHFLTEQEQRALAHITHSGSERADVAMRVREVLMVASGCSDRQAAIATGRRSYQSVSQLVTRFNRDGLAALEIHQSGDHPPLYDAAAREQILAEARRAPDSCLAAA
jgi:transposase